MVERKLVITSNKIDREYYIITSLITLAGDDPGIIGAATGSLSAINSIAAANLFIAVACTSTASAFIFSMFFRDATASRIVGSFSKIN